MALTRRTGQRFQASIWPGFVDAMTALLLVLMFVLTIFMIVQFMLREEITGQENRLFQLSNQVASLADALGLEQERSEQLQNDLERITASLNAAQEEGAAQAALIEKLSADLSASQAEGSRLSTRIDDLEGQVSSLEAGLASARTEIDTQTEAARLAAARREALEALIADLREQGAQAQAEAERLEAALSEEEAARLAEAEAARALRERLNGAEEELTALTLSLEQERKRAEDTLTLLAAAEAAKNALQTRVEELSEAEAQAALLAVAQERLAEEEEKGIENQRRVTLLNQQITQLRTQLLSLQGLLDAAEERDRKANVQIEALGTELNTALAQVASEQRRRAELEEAERKRLEEEAKELENYRSDFFGKLREVLADRQGVRIVGDRFVFSSEVLFQPGSASLAPEGRSQIASVAALLSEVARDIPPEIDWILRVDGHTDNLPLSGGGRYADNWELSQARALSVVRFLTEELGFAPDRLAATGFGEYRPVSNGNRRDDLAQNRRIELKLTER